MAPTESSLGRNNPMPSKTNVPLSRSSTGRLGTSGSFKSAAGKRKAWFAGEFPTGIEDDFAERSYVELFSSELDCKTMVKMCSYLLLLPKKHDEET